MIKTLAHINDFGGSDGDHMSSSSEYWMVVVMTVFLVVVIAIFVAYFLQRNNTNSDNGSSNNAAETLKQRLAAGEIDANEYKKLKKVIDGS